ncbi:MAG: FlgO family outer membrane protein [Calditrichaceae bacterium]
MRFSNILIIFLYSFLIINCASNAPAVKNQNTESQNTLDAQLQLLTDKIVISLAQTQKSKIAVIEFSNLEGKITKFGRYLAEELITRLYLTNRFQVIERQLLNKVIQEYELNLSGLVDVSSAQELGRILGVDAIASGSVTDLGEKVKVNARLISTQTGQIFSVASVTIKKDDVVKKLMGTPVVMEAPIDDTHKRDVFDPVAPTQNPKTDLSLEQNGYLFELTKCVMEDRKITCSLIVTNQSENDKTLRIQIRETKLFDQTGNEYQLTFARIANSISKKDWYRLDKQLVAGISTPMELTFENISSATSAISLLSIKFGYGVDVVKFRDAPLEIIN